jgi:hypothetical protein
VPLGCRCFCYSGQQQTVEYWEQIRPALIERGDRSHLPPPFSSTSSTWSHNNSRTPQVIPYFTVWSVSFSTIHPSLVFSSYRLSIVYTAPSSSPKHSWRRGPPAETPFSLSLTARANDKESCLCAGQLLPHQHASRAREPGTLQNGAMNWMERWK